MYRFKGFTEKANTALNLAIEAAQELGHTYIVTEHIVLGLLREGTGVAASVLGARGVTAAQYRRPFLRPVPEESLAVCLPMILRLVLKRRWKWQ